MGSACLNLLGWEWLSKVAVEYCGQGEMQKGWSLSKNRVEYRGEPELPGRDCLSKVGIEYRGVSELLS